MFPSPASLHDGVRAGLPGSLWVTRLIPPHLGSLTPTRGRTKGCQPSSKPMGTPSCDGVSCPHTEGTGQSLGCKDRMGPTRCPGAQAPAPPLRSSTQDPPSAGLRSPPPQTEARTPGGQSTCLREAQGREAQVHLCRLTGRTTPGGALVCTVDSGDDGVSLRLHPLSRAHQWGCRWWGRLGQGRSTWEISVPSSQFCWEPN